nr:ATP-binding protein [Aestuariivirga litoralis]
MRRLDRAAWLIRSRKPDDPSAVPEENLPKEVQPFVASINELVGRLNDNVEQQKRFVSDAAHELRTPLTAIGIQIGNLENSLTTAAQRERIAPLKAGAKRANQLIEQLLQLARAEKGRVAVQDEVSLGAIFSTLQSTFDPIAVQNKIELSFANASSGLALNQHDAIHVLTALIENAIAYSQPGSRVTVSASPESIVVQDEGPGIPPEKLPHIFERFYRASNGLVPGTGLGLSIAKAVCDQRGWLLHIANRQDRAGIRAVLQVKKVSA